MRVLRNEINTRMRFAKEQGEFWFKQIKSVEKGGGNVLSCKASEKYRQACRINDHYKNEFTKYLVG